MARDAQPGRAEAGGKHLRYCIAGIARFDGAEARRVDLLGAVARLHEVSCRVAGVSHHPHLEDQSLAQVEGGEAGGA